MVVLILMGRIVWKAVTFILNLLHLIRVDWWMEGSAYSQAQTAPPYSQTNRNAFLLFQVQYLHISLISANLKIEWGYACWIIQTLKSRPYYYCVLPWPFYFAQDFKTGKLRFRVSGL